MTEKQVRPRTEGWKQKLDEMAAHCSNRAEARGQRRFISPI